MKAAYIGRIYIENFHAFQGKNEIPIIKEDGTLQQWTVIVGENNSGKTSLLKAVAGLEAVLDDTIDDSKERFTPRGNTNLRLETNVGAEIGCDLMICDIIDSDLKDVKLSFIRKHEKSRLRQWGYEYISMGDFGPSMLKTFIHQNQEILYIKNLQVYGYGVSRKVSDNTNATGYEFFFGRNNLTLLFEDKTLIDTTDWLFQLYFASKNSGEPFRTKAIDRIKHIKKLIISEIFPDIFDLRFTTTDDLKNHLEFQTKDGWFQLHELGYGYQTTLAWIFDLSKKMMERYPDSKQPLRQPAVVLIDEIDLHLHPAWQRRIINYLSDNFTATQFIVTTHSPHVLQELKEVNLVQLKRENGATKIICRPNSSFQGWTIEEILNDVLETPATHSTRYEELMQKFDQALDNEDFKTAHEIYETLLKILHPSSPDRKILEIQLSQLTA